MKRESVKERQGRGECELETNTMLPSHSIFDEHSKTCATTGRVLRHPVASQGKQVEEAHASTAVMR